MFKQNYKKKLKKYFSALKYKIHNLKYYSTTSQT